MTRQDSNGRCSSWFSQAVSALIVCAGLMTTTGCLSIEQSLTLEPNLAGRAGFNMTIDMEPMVGMMAAFTRSMSGESGPPTAADLEKARAEFLKDAKQNFAAEQEKERKVFESSLPKGVTLLDSKFSDAGLKVTANLLLGFDQVSKLSTITFPKKAAAGGGPPEPGNPVDSPFGDLRVVDEGATLLITSAAKNPMADDAPPAGMLDPAMTKMMEAMLSGVRMAFKIAAPFTVLETNAHRRDGTTLIWDFDMATINKLTPAQRLEGMKVRYRK